MGKDKSITTMTNNRKMNMEQIGDMKFIDFEETLDRELGKVGTPKRDEFERKVEESVRANRIQNRG